MMFLNFVVLTFVLATFFSGANGLRLSMNSKYLGKSPVFVAGGSSGVGLEVIKKLSAAGTPVHTLIRRKDAEVFLKTLNGVQVSIGDALDPAAVQKSMQGCVAAISTLGGQPAAGHVERVDYAGNSNVIEQAGILGVERILLVTSVGCGASNWAIPRHIHLALEGALSAKTRAENDLKMYTNLDWTIIRPGGLTSEPPTGKAILTEDIMASGSLTREDCASLIVKVLGSDGHYTRRALTAVDPSISNTDYDYKPFKLF